MTFELPPGIGDLGRLVELLNDRFRRIAEKVTEPFKATGDLDAAGHRIRNLGDARVPTDGLNLGMADRRYLTVAGAHQYISNTTVGGSSVTNITQGGGAGASQVVLSVPGTLSIRSNAAPLVQLSTARNVASIRALLKQAPVGGTTGLSLVLKAGAAELAQLSIPADQAVANLTTTGKAIPAGASVVLDITAVGTTFPGADLSVILFLA